MSLARARRVAAAGGAVLAAAVLYGLAFPPVARGEVAAVALVPWLVAVRRAGPRGALALAVLFALLACATTIGWLPAAASTYFQQPAAVGMATWLGIALLMIAPAVVGFAFAYRAAAAWPAGVRPLLGAAAWTAAELARARLLGNPFALLGATQVGAPPAIQIADLAGVYGIGFVLAAVNVALAEAWVAWRDGRGWRAGTAPLAAAAACVALQLGYGMARLSGASPRPAVPVLIVQGDLDLGTQWRDEFFGRNLDVYLQLTLTGLREHPAALVLWPENAMTFFLADEPLYRQAIARVLAPFGGELIAGGPAVAVRQPEAFFNSAFALGPDGDIRARYDKQRLLPVAEAFPLRGVDLLRRRFGRVREFTPGGPAALLPTAAGPAGVLICNEILYPELAASRARAGAALLVNLTNDGWIGDRGYAAAALGAARLRAVEQRRWVLRASTSGPAAIIDPCGRLMAATAFGSRAVLAGAVAGAGGETPYARLGDAFALACAAVAILAWSMAPRLRP